MKPVSAFLLTTSLLAASFLMRHSTPAGQIAPSGNSTIVIDATVPASPPKPLPFAVGGRSSTGHVFSANSRYLLLDGKPWFPIMGEFHFSRYPAADWDEEILKMKAGGIQVVSTYVFWIHQEEIEGQFDWTGQRDLRRFVELCAKHGLYVWVRIGPWDHGECRNGGFPDWVVQKCKTRRIDPLFLSYVQSFYDQIGAQLKGLLWVNGGPVMGIQLDNEYSARGPGEGAEYILTLRRMARKAGLDVPFYTVTGWDNAVVPSRDILPVFGGYADAFWSRSVKELPPNPNFFFTSIRCDENVADDLRSKRPDIDALDAKYPYLMAELGDGMEVAYHRRPVVTADDTGAMALVKMGSGASMFGYYIFHGGTNPDGKKTTLQESQATGYPNDLPVKSYDYGAPLGEFGQVHPSFRILKTLNIFAADFGSDLVQMPAYFPERTPASKEDSATPRVAARVLNGRGFIFINNHQRLYPLPERKDFQIELRLPKETVKLPRTPTDVPSGAYTIWPVNLKVGPSLLRYATAQLLCRLDASNTYVFFAWPGIPAEFAFATTKGITIESAGGTTTNDGNVTYVSGIQPGTNVAIRIEEQGRESAQVLLLSRDEALDAWRTGSGKSQRFIVSPADLYFDADSIHLLSANPANLTASVFPPLDEGAQPSSGLEDRGEDGVFRTYAVSETPVTTHVRVQELAAAGDPPPIAMERGVALAPGDAAFQSAASWRIRVPDSALDSRTIDNAYLVINYKGDVARLYVGEKLFTDNFYNGTPWIIGLKDIPRKELADGLELRILPLRKDDPLYLPKGAWPEFPSSGEIATLNSVTIRPEYEGVMNFTEQTKASSSRPLKPAGRRAAQPTPSE